MWSPPQIQVEFTSSALYASDGVKSTQSTLSIWSPSGLQVDSRWILTIIWQGFLPKIIHLDSTWSPQVHLTPRGVHLESMGECKVLISSTICVLRAESVTHGGRWRERKKGAEWKERGVQRSSTTFPSVNVFPTRGKYCQNLAVN